jgi:hypothetical protein
MHPEAQACRDAWAFCSALSAEGTPVTALPAPREGEAEGLGAIRLAAESAALGETLGMALKRVTCGTTTSDLAATISLNGLLGGWSWLRSDRTIVALAKTGKELWGGQGGTDAVELRQRIFEALRRTPARSKMRKKYGAQMVERARVLLMQASGPPRGLGPWGAMVADASVCIGRSLPASLWRCSSSGARRRLSRTRPSLSGLTAWRPA